MNRPESHEGFTSHDEAAYFGQQEVEAIVTEYLRRVEAVMNAMTEANIEAVESFEADHPEVVDMAYASAGPLEYDIATGTVHAVQAA